MNDDLISRQATIEAIYDNKDRLNIAQAIRELPPVNPQEPKYCDRNICVSNEYNGIGCDECEVTKSQEPKTIQEKQAESEKYDKAFEDGYENGYAQARFDYEQEPKWIPVSERLPEEDNFYLVTAKVGNELIIDISEYTPKNDFWDIPHEIVAWLPLPKPYKTESEEV